MADDNPAEASSAKPEAKPVNCNICNKSFPHKGSLRRHRQSKHPVKKEAADASEAGQDGEAASTFDCVLCKQSFPRQSSLTQHQRSKHGPPKPEAPDTSVAQTQAAEPKTEPSAANEASTSAKQEDVNQGDKSRESKATCSNCNRSFSHRGALYQHKKTKHRTVKADNDTPAKEEDKTPDAEEKTINCDVCDKVFTSRNSLRRHLKSKHTSDKKGKGPAKSSAQGDKAAGSSKQVHTTLKERHIAGSQKFKCLCCNENFPSEDTLMKHQAEQRLEAMRKVMENMARAATGMRVSNGQDGSDEESEAPELVEETATEEKKATNMHQCTLCDKSFRFKSALVQHRLIKHAVADDTVAESSGQGANATAGGKKAEDVDEDNEDKPYCQTCQKTFRHAKGLADHKLNKHGIVEPEPSSDSKQGVPENPTFRCRPCNKTFRLASALRQHQRDSHPEMHRPRYSEDEIMRQLLRMAVPPFGDDDDDDYEDEDYEDYEDEDDPFSYPGHRGHPFDFPAGIQPGDIYDSDDIDFGYPGFSDDDDDDHEDDSSIDMDNERGPPTLCTHCNEYSPQMLMVAHQWHVHGISHPAVVDVQAKIAKDDSYGPKRTVCKRYPDPKDFPFFFEAKYFLRDCKYKNCGQDFETGTERINHEVEAHNRCITCDMYFQTRSALEKHQSDSKVVDTVVRDFDHWLEFAVPAQVHHEKQKAKAARNPNRSKNIDCITCERKFEKASTMMKHVENGRCIPKVNELDIFALGQILAEQGAPCVRLGGFFCPICDRSYMVLSELIQHAEGDECSLNVLSGPLRELISMLMMEFYRMVMGHIADLGAPGTEWGPEE
ncbi:C2H2-type zinc finger transcription factor [Fusarium mundagurra]|uniref:C2H2-type zinc finger transcription factor n=1 Tax=Fusarium mundagurra TaxID=1567541 RepID=A0A8H6DMC7_9HYPO|nr:C2H2-type zinc finger transcription factor [Fusarium mundagurra]